MSNLAQQLVLAAKQIRRALRLSPMHLILKQLRQQGFRPEAFQTLEAFGGTGVSHTPDIYGTVAELDIWDVSPARQSLLRQKFPRAKTMVVDSYLAMQQVAKTYDLVVLDSGERMGGRYEHFEMFPYVYRALKPRAVLILNETPVIKDTDPERLRQRREFYQVNDAANVSWDQVRDTYRRLSAQNSYQLEHIFFERRWVFALTDDPMYYCIMLLRALPS